MKENALESYRYAAIELLTEAYTADHLDIEEFERRAALVHNALTPTEVQHALVDLTASTSLETPLEEPSAPGTGDDSTPQILSILAERRLSGDWLEGGRGSALTVLGSSRLDLRDTALNQQIIFLHIVAIMGETRIVIPPDVRVENNISAVLAEVSINTPRNAVKKRRTLRLSGLAVMGEIRIDVKG